nr:protein PLASTID MOVEMENT IMPAIRED 1-RELATED 1-like [Ipomoea batatas]GMD41154.1 protein PLASTID MOVEMENT IMPAIRED 1-RELATED 1-like [Ipomoea batatas]
MSSKLESRKKIGQNPGTGKLLNDIESISKALSLDKAQPRRLMSTVSSRSKSVGKTHLPDSKSKAKGANKDLLEDGKKSIWSWKGFKALTHVKSRTFNCCFSLHVHCVEGLPVSFDDLSLVVHWKRRDGELTSRAVRVVQGVAEFEEQLTYSCSVHGSGNGPHHSAKYEAKHFLLYVSICGTPEIDLGKHRVDLTRLLPLTLEELEDEKSTGRWTTSYRLSGKARGATINVSFGYYVIGNNSTVLPASKDVHALQNLRKSGPSGSVALFTESEQTTARRAGSLPASSSASSWSVEDIKELHEVLPVPMSELSESVNVLYRKLEEEKLDASVNEKLEIDVISNAPESLKPDSKPLPVTENGNAENECEISELSTMDQGLELSSKELEKPGIQTMDAVHHSVEGCFVSDNVEVSTEVEAQLQTLPKEIGCNKDELPVCDLEFEEKEKCNNELIMEELDSALDTVSDLVNEESDSRDDSEIINQDNYLGVQADYKPVKKGKSLSMDDVTQSVASDFFNMLGIEHSPFGFSSESEPDSPRERLLRQFEKDALATGCSLFNCEIDIDDAEFVGAAPSGPDYGNISEDFGFFSATQSSEVLPKTEIEEARNKTRAAVMEDLETEALMREWGLNERAFQYSPPKSSGGFGSPINVPLEDLDILPPLGEGLGPFVQTKDGGLLRSMSPALFKHAKGGGKLSMQVSKPVVVPAEMGSGVMDILQHLTSIGIEKLSMQANKLMPLEDITGKTVQQIAWEAASSLEGSERNGKSHEEFTVGQNMSGFPDAVRGNMPGSRSSEFEPSSIGNEQDAEYLSLGDVAPLAMDKIEGLLIEGLRIQSGMSSEEAPSNVSPHSDGELSTFEGMVSFGGSMGLEGAGGMHLLDIKDNGDDVDGLMGLSLSLDEWMKLDSGDIYEDDEISERTSKLLAAHHATSMEVVRGRSRDKRRGKGRKCGLLGNNFTVALMVQLRDPLRDYEPVGRPMLALVQVEREFVPPKPMIYSSVSEIRRSNNDEEDDDSQPVKKEEIIEELKVEKIPEEEKIPRYKITEVHVAGLNTDQGKKKLWGSKTQQQSGSRWLLANGMGKKNKHPLMKSKPGNKATLPPSDPATTTVQPGETLWSISSRVHGTGAKWKELAALNPHIRNPNVIFPNETIRLR